MKFRGLRLRRVTIKPILSCTANCPTCERRRELYKSLRGERELSLEEWGEVLVEAKNLGCIFLDISGGEPTMYRQLPDLVRIGRDCGLIVNVNSNGSLINEKYAEELLQAGLNSITISLYSSVADVHDNMKRAKGLWQKATSAIRTFTKLGGGYPKFKTKAQTILCRENYESFADLLELHYKLGSHNLIVSYLEDDSEIEHLLNEDEIRYFREHIIPKAVECCKRSDMRIRNKAIRMVNSIFSEDILSTSDWARGIYRPKNRNLQPCQVPKQSAMILANGDVLPCNTIEYYHEPMVGNLFDDSLTKIWHSKEFDRFREVPPIKCELCPMNLHLYIPLRPTGLVYGCNVMRRVVESFLSQTGRYLWAGRRYRNIIIC